MTAALLAAILMMVLAPRAAQAREGCQTRACHERVAAKQCSQARPRACVTRAIITYRLHGWQAAWMRRVPGCESGWDPLAYFSMQVAETAAERAMAIAQDRSAGLYAFKPSTWAGLRYRDRSLFQAKWSALGAALMVRSGRTGEWACR